MEDEREEDETVRFHKRTVLSDETSRVTMDIRHVGVYSRPNQHDPPLQ